MADISYRDVTRKLRKQQTSSEELFWEKVRGRKMNGKKFLRQFLIPFEHEGQKRFFTADFYCAECRLIVEIDGSVHDDRQEYDNLRTDILNKLGIRVIRFRNEDVQERLPEVLEKVKEFL